MGPLSFIVFRPSAKGRGKKRGKETDFTDFILDMNNVSKQEKQPGA